MKPLNEVMDELNDGLDVKIKMSYQLEKSTKKSWGKYRAFEIAFGRKLVMMMKNPDLECKNPKCRCKERRKING
jgi:hypothetical protein